MNRRQAILKACLLLRRQDKEESLAKFLLMYMLDETTEQFSNKLSEELSVEQENRYFDLINKNINEDTPLSHLVGFDYFYDRKFKVTKDVLSPRMETEELIYKVLEHIKKSKKDSFRILDLCTGSGIIAITLKKEIVEKYGRLKCIEFIGLQTRENLMKYYSKIETVIFPSKLETWGLPISEAKAFGKNIILADLEYAHETLGTYEKVMFFGPDAAEKLAEKMKMLINDDENMKNIEFDGNFEKNIEKPFCKNWKELFDILLLDNR